MLNGVFRALRATSNWLRMQRLSVDGKYSEALSLARSAEELVRARPYWQLFEIQQMGLLNDHVGTLELAKPFIENYSSKDNLTTKEKYFLAFAQWYAQVAFRRLHSTQPLPQALEFDLSSFSLAEVPNRWKRTFPMAMHPDWEEDKKSRTN